MKRKLSVALCLVLAAAMLAGCSAQPQQNEAFPEVTQALRPGTSTPTPEPMQSAPYDDAQGGQSIFDTNPYDVAPEVGYSDTDPINEENYIDPELDNTGDNSGMAAYYAQPQDTIYPYAGSTPIPLDPIDMPSPTPRGPLNFTNVAYTSANLGLTFEAPSGWQVDESDPQMMILSEPEAQIKDGQQCIITISAEPVTGNYSQNDLRSQVNERLDTIGGVDFETFKPSYTATRYMMGSEGVYANYSGRMVDGIEVGGRIMYVCIDRVLYGLEIVYPSGYRDDFLDVYGAVRKSMKRAN